MPIRHDIGPRAAPHPAGNPYYAKNSELAAGLQADAGTAASDDLDARRRDAGERLFALRDERPDCDGPTFADTLESLYRPMPERLRRHDFLGAEAAALFQAA